MHPSPKFDEVKEHGSEPHRPFHWDRDHVRGLLIGFGLLALWIGSTAIFGFAGLITIALLLVLAAFVGLIVISLG